MIQFEYPQMDALTQQIWERIMKLSLPYQIKIRPELKQVLIKEGQQIYQGPAAIGAYLDQREAEIQAWYACTCDDWEGIVD